MNIISELIRRLENDRAAAKVRLSAKMQEIRSEDWMARVTYERAIISQCSATLSDIRELTQKERSI